MYSILGLVVMLGQLHFSVTIISMLNHSPTCSGIHVGRACVSYRVWLSSLKPGASFSNSGVTCITSTRGSGICLVGR